MFSKQSLDIKKELFSSLTYDYLTENEKLQPFYSFFPNKVGFKNAIDAISKFDYNRSLLISELKKDAELVKNTSNSSKKNIELLSDKTTFTITTGHQLCLFTGRLILFTNYFL